MATETDKIVVDYEANVKGFTAQLKTVQVEMAKTEKSGVDAANKTTESFVKTEVAAKSLKTQLKELKAQLAIATDPKDVERLAKAAGEIKNKLDDATKAAQIFASDSKFEQVGTALRGIAGNLLSLNFKQAADQSKLLVAASKQITFKEALGGVKDLGTTLLNIGKSLLSNPLFLLGTAITVIISNFDKLKNAGGAIGSFFTGIGNLITGVTNGITAMSDAIGLTNSTASLFAETQKKNAEETKKYIDDVTEQIIKNNQAALIALGRLTEGESARKASRDKFNAEFKAEFIKQQQEIAALREIFDKETDSMLAETAFNRASRERKLEQDELKIKDAHAVKLNYITELYQSEQFKLNADGIKAKRDEQAKADADELRAKKEQAKKLLEDNTPKVIAELNDTRTEDQAFYNAKVQAFNDLQALQDEAEKEASDSGDRITDKVKQDLKERLEAERKAEEEKQAIIAESERFIIQSLNAIGEINKRRTDARLEESQEAASVELAILDEQLKKRLISQEQYDIKKANLEKDVKKREAEIKRKQFENDKQLALIEAAINTAVAVTKALPNYALAAIVAFAGAAEIALIASQPTPKFEKGGKVKGKRHSEGGVIVEAEKDEWVINRTQSIKHDKLLESINKGKVESFINEVYLAPVLRKQIQKHEESKNKSFANNIANSILLKQYLNDGNILESLKKSRKNDQEIAMFLVKNLNPKVNKYNW